MHLAELYSSTSRLQIDKPILNTQFVPLPFSDSYILLGASTGMPGKNYPFWEEVFDIIKQFLGDIKIIQVGLKNDPTFRGVDLNLCGQTNLYELSYLIKNAVLSISGDTSTIHLADAFQTPLVALFGLTDPRISGGFFGDKTKQIYLEPDRSKYPPTFNPNDQCVATIPPETVSKAILKQLNIDKEINLQTKLFCPLFLHKTLEVIPNMIIDPNQFQGSLLNIRGDKEFNEGGIYQNIANYPSVVYTNKPLNIDILKQVKPNIRKLIYILDEGHSLKFVKALRKAAIPYECISYMDQEWINSLKFDYCDYAIIHKRNPSILPPELNVTNLKFKTARYVLSLGKIYLSYWHALKDLSTPNFDLNFGDIPEPNHPEFLDGFDYYWIYTTD